MEAKGQLVLKMKCNTESERILNSTKQLNNVVGVAPLVLQLQTLDATESMSAGSLYPASQTCIGLLLERAYDTIRRSQPVPAREGVDGCPWQIHAPITCPPPPRKKTTSSSSWSAHTKALLSCALLWERFHPAIQPRWSTNLRHSPNVQPEQEHPITWEP